jgi:glycosyltransferase involved in cell wall biosynthesis
MFYVYKNDNDPFLLFFKSMNYVTVKSIPQKIITQSNIYYSLDTYDKCDPSNNMINILVIHDSIIDVQSVRGFNYYLPVTPNLYFKYISDFGLKLLLPINIFKQTNWTKYYIDSSLSKYTKSINGVLSTFDNSNIIIINNNTRSLDSSKISKNKKIFNLDIKKGKYDLFTINNYLSLCSVCSNHLENPPKIEFEIKLILINDLFGKKIELKANQYYIIARNGFKFIQDIRDSYSFKMFFNYNFNLVSFLSTNGVTNEVVLFVHPETDISKTFIELFEKIQYHDYRIIGTNTNALSADDNYRLHYFYAKYKLYHMIEYMMDYESMYYDVIIKYICNVNCCFKRKFNIDKFIRYVHVWAAENAYEINKKEILEFIDKNKELFIQEKILLIGKNINSYGGSQKTSLQVYNELLLSNYDVKIAAIGKTDLVSKIDKQDIIYFKNILEISTHIQKVPYAYVIINKLDEILENIDKCISKSIFISHNSMDLVNSKIISMSKYLHKVFTVNNEHQSLLFENNIECSVVKYINYLSNMNKVTTRTKFKNRIVYIGRISKEKNIELLLSAFTEFNKMNQYELLIIGDGKFNISNTPNVILLGKQDYNSILFYLSNSDYLIIPSSTEGCPFVILEAFNIGIPVITSNIIGSNELVINNENGFSFDYYQYDQYRNTINNWDVIDHNLKNIEMNIPTLVSTLKNAYNISIDKWNEMSENAYRFSNENYGCDHCIYTNIKHITKLNNLLLITLSNLPTPIKYFDIKSEYTLYDLYQYDIIIHLTKMIEHMYIVPVLYRIKLEMIEQDIHKISDSHGNYIVIYSESDKELIIEDISTLLEGY